MGRFLLISFPRYQIQRYMALFPLNMPIRGKSGFA